MAGGRHLKAGLRTKTNARKIERLATKTSGRVSNSLRSFDNFSGLNAAGADLLLRVAAAGHLDADRLEIRVETPPRFVVSVGHVVTKLRAFPANVAAFCHIGAPIGRIRSIEPLKVETRFITKAQQCVK